MDKSSEDKPKMGAPSKYKEEYVEQVEKLYRLGSKDTQVADFFNVTEQTLHNWKASRPDFLESIRAGKDYWDGEAIEKSLCKRAMGYTVEEEKHEEGTAGTKTTITKRHIPASDTAMIYWLNNRSRGRFKQKQEVEHSGEGITFNVTYTAKNAD